MTNLPTSRLLTAAGERAAEGGRARAVGARAQGAALAAAPERTGLVQEFAGGSRGRHRLPAQEALGRLPARRMARPRLQDHLPVVAILVFQSTAQRRNRDITYVYQSEARFFIYLFSLTTVINYIFFEVGVQIATERRGAAFIEAKLLMRFFFFKFKLLQRKIALRIMYIPREYSRQQATRARIFICMHYY